MKDQLINSICELQRLESLDLNSENSYSEIISAIQTHVVIPYFSMKIPIGTVFFRARINEGKPFTLKSQLSYNNDFKSINIGRANYQGQSIFYGGHIEETAIFEVSKILRDMKIGSTEYVTIGVWTVIKPFEVLPIISDQEFLDTHNDIFKKYHKELKRNHLFKHPLVQEHLEFISRVFSKKVQNSVDYKFSCALFNRMMDERIENIGGILYPSIEYEKKDLNIAIIPEFVDNCLVLSYIDEYLISINEWGGNFIQIGRSDCSNFHIKRFSLR